MPSGHDKKRSFLEGGKGFKLEAFSNDVYPLLPQLWHAMLPSKSSLVYTPHKQRDITRIDFGSDLV